MTTNINKTKLSETDIITKFILPAVKQAGWDDMTQIRQEVKLRDGKVIVRGQAAARKKVKSADIVLYHKPSMPLAVIEAKANKHEIGKGMQQGLDYASLLEARFIFASNGDYLNLSMNAPYFRVSQIDPHIKKQCGQANVNGTLMKSMLVPIPHFNEQHHIVTKVDELMAICDQLKTKLAESQQTQLHLTDAIVEQVV